MTKNKKKAVRLIRSGRPITEKRFPMNYEPAMKFVYGPEAKPSEIPMTEAEFHQEYSVEKEQV